MNDARTRLWTIAGRNGILIGRSFLQAVFELLLLVSQCLKLCGTYSYNPATREAKTATAKQGGPQGGPDRRLGGPGLGFEVPVSLP